VIWSFPAAAVNCRVRRSLICDHPRYQRHLRAARQVPDPGVLSWLDSLEVSDAASLRAEGDWLTFAVVWREAGKVVGEVGLKLISWENRQGEIG